VASVARPREGIRYALAREEIIRALWEARERKLRRAKEARAGVGLANVGRASIKSPSD